MSKTMTPPHLLTLIFLTGFSPLSLNMFIPSLANIAKDLATDYATASLAISGYLAITAVIQLIVGPLSDRIGRRPVLLVAVFIFACASVGCVFAQDIETFLFFRIFQGGMAAGYSLSMAIVRDTRSEKQAVSLIGYIGMSMAIAPMLGPILGGVLDTLFGWRATFVFYAISGLSLFALCWFDLGETKRDLGQAKDVTPVKPNTLFKEPLFWAFSLCGAFSVGGFYIFLTGAPLVALSHFGVTTVDLGTYIGSITVGFMLGGYIAGKYASRFDLTVMMIAGRIVACSGLTIGLVLLTMGYNSPQLFFASTIFVGLGNGLTLPSTNTGAMSVRPDLAGSAAGLNGALIVASGAVLTLVTGVLISETNSVQLLLLLMLGSSGIGLFLSLWAAKLRKSERYA